MFAVTGFKDTIKWLPRYKWALLHKWCSSRRQYCQTQ